MADFGLLDTDPAATQARAFNYANQIQQLATQKQAGQQFATGDYQGAAKTQAEAGNIDNARNIQDYGIQHFQMQQQYLQRALPVFTQIYQKAGPQALLQAFDHVTPDLQTLGVAPDKIQQYRQAFAQDPQGTLQSLGALAQHQFQYHSAGDEVFITNENGQLVGRYVGTKFVPVQQGGSVAAVGGDVQTATPNLGGPAPQPQEQPAQPQPGATVGPIPAPAGGQAPLGIRTNNPGNLQPGGKEATFENPTAGVLAASANLDSYAKQGINTVAGIIGKWAPPNENNTTAYTQFVANKLGVSPDAPLDLTNHNVKGKLLEAMFQMENGQQPQLPNGPQQQAPQGGGARIVADNRVPIDQSAIDNDVKLWIASKGQINPQYGMGQSGAAYRQAFTAAKNRIMAQMGVTPEDVASGQAARKADTQSLSKLQSMADQIQAFESTANKNADLALQLSKAGGAQGQAPLVNRWVQEYRRWIHGDKDVSAFTAALGTFADEYAKVVGGQNGSTDSLRSEAYRRVNEAMNQGQLQSVIATMKKEMANRTDSNNLQLDTIKARLGDRSAQDRLNNPGAGNAPAPANIPAGAIALLKKNPSLRSQFDQKYGQGAAAKVLGG